MTDIVWQIVWLALIALLFAALLAPLETLGWWAGWFGDIGRDRLSDAADPSRSATQPEAYVVLLMGINAVGADLRPAHEDRFIAELGRALGPGFLVVTDAFPYSAFGLPLTGDRSFAWLWRRIAKVEGGGELAVGALGFLINLRNALQVGVSADRRYGPLYNLGAAEVLAETLLAAGFCRHAAPPVVLVGYSGGGQIGLGAAGDLGRLLGARIGLVSIGGVLASEPSLDALAGAVHIAGTKDGLQRVGALIFPQRWPVMPHSAWNRAKAEGRLQFRTLEGVAHAGALGYFSEGALGGGQSCLQATVALVSAEIRTLSVRQSGSAAVAR